MENPDEMFFKKTISAGLAIVIKTFPASGCIVNIRQAMDVYWQPEVMHEVEKFQNILWIINGYKLILMLRQNTISMLIWSKTILAAS